MLIFASTRWKRGSAQRISAPHATNAASAASGTQRIVGQLRIAMTRVVSLHVHVQDVRHGGLKEANTLMIRLRHGDARNTNSDFRDVLAFI